MRRMQIADEDGANTASEVDEECSNEGNHNVSTDKQGQESSDLIPPVLQDCGENDESQVSTSSSDSESSDNNSDVDLSDNSGSGNGSPQSSSSNLSSRCSRESGSSGSDSNEYDSDENSTDFLFEGSNMASNEGLL